MEAKNAVLTRITKFFNRCNCIYEHFVNIIYKNRPTLYNQWKIPTHSNINYYLVRYYHHHKNNNNNSGESLFDYDNVKLRSHDTICQQSHAHTVTQSN